MTFIYLFLERGEGREKERDRNINVPEKHQSIVSHMLPTADLARNPACADRESNLRPLVRRLALNPLSHTSQDSRCHV